MKVTVVISALAAFAVVAAVQKRATRFDDNSKVDVTDSPHEDYQNYIEEFHPNYSPDDDHHQRVAKFHKCRQDILDHDPDEAGYSKVLTKFSHMTDDEIAEQWNHVIGLPDIKKPDAPKFQYTERDLDEARQAGSVDWRQKGAVSSVKDQGQCGSCYTFAAAAALEGQVKVKLGKLVNISTQQYVDCAQNYGVDQQYVSVNNQWVLVSSFSSNAGGNQGCDGGLSEYCYAYNNLTAKQDTWECYPYSSGESQQPGDCSVPSCNAKFAVKGFVSVADENALLVAINKVGPIACGLDASSLQSYGGGILDESTCSTSANHAITVVGYGHDSKLNQDYWLIKNSWSADWGEQGYFRIPRGVNACGIGSNDCVYPTF